MLETSFDFLLCCCILQLFWDEDKKYVTNNFDNTIFGGCDEDWIENSMQKKFEFSTTRILRRTLVLGGNH